MKAFRVIVLLFLVAPLIYGQDSEKTLPPWLRSKESSQNTKATNASETNAATFSLEGTPYNITEIPSPESLRRYLDDSNQYVDLEKFLFTNGGNLGNVPIIPPMPPLLTNSNSQDIINFIKTNMAIMAMPAQSNTSLQPKTKPKEQRAFLDNRDEYYLPKASEGLWWRYYSQNTSVFNIPAAVEEMLVISAETGEAVWMQNIQTANSVQSKSQRRLLISMYILDNPDQGKGLSKKLPLWFFYYPSTINPSDSNSENPKVAISYITNAQNVEETPAYFVQIFPEQGFMQMSKNPRFPADQTMFWRRFPRAVPSIVVPPLKFEEETPEKIESGVPTPKAGAPAPPEEVYDYEAALPGARNNQDDYYYINPEEVAQ